MLEKVKLALRIVTDDFDDEITDLIEAAVLDLGIAGVLEQTTPDAIIIRAVCTYCKLNFGECSDYANLKASYDEQKAQLAMATGYTDWSK